MGIMASETTFDHWKVVFSWGKMRKSRFSQNPLNARFWAFGFLIYTSSSANFKKDPPRNIFLSQSMFLPLVLCNCLIYFRWNFSPVLFFTPFPTICVLPNKAWHNSPLKLLKWRVWGGVGDQCTEFLDFMGALFGRHPQKEAVLTRRYV